MAEDLALAEARHLWVLRFLEHVVADKEDAREMSSVLGFTWS